MNLNEWIAGNDSVDWELVLNKALLLDRAATLCMCSVLQKIFVKQRMELSNYVELAKAVVDRKEITSSFLDTLIPKENHFSSDPNAMRYFEEVRNACDDDGFALQALQDMELLDFSCEIDREGLSIEDGYWRGFELVASHLFVLHRLFANTLHERKYRNVDGRKLQHLDLSTGKLLFSAGQFGASAVEHAIQNDGIVKMKKGEQIKKKEKIDKVKKLYEELKNSTKRRGITHVSKVLEKKWPEKYPGENRSAKQIGRDLKALKIY